MTQSVPIREVSWPHAPLHRLSASGTYMVTSATYRKANHFRGADRLAVIHRGLLSVAAEFEWQLEAWAVFSNHYHFIGHSPRTSDSAENLRKMLGKLHGKTAAWINRVDETPGRQIWHNYWDSMLTYEKSYLARLNYVHQNAVHHGLVQRAGLYPWCSASWFERTASPAQVKTIYGFEEKRIRVFDDFAVAAEW